LAASGTAAGAEVDDVVGGEHDGGVVFDNEDGVAGVAEAVECGDDAIGVAGVESDGGFVEDEEGVDECGAEAGGEVDALEFAAGEGAGLAVEREVAEADVVEVAKAGECLCVGAVGGGVSGFWEVCEEVEGVADREGVELGDGEAIAVGIGKVPAEGLWLEACAAAGGAGFVAAVAGEVNADVHFVGFGFEPLEEAVDAIPEAFAPGGVGVEAVGFAVKDGVLVFWAEVFPGDVGGDFEAFAGVEEVALAFLAGFGLPGFDGAVSKGEVVVGDDEVVIDADDTAKAFAVGAGAEGVVEAEECG
jgi:hypothetical protein